MENNGDLKGERVEPSLSLTISAPAIPPFICSELEPWLWEWYLGGGGCQAIERPQLNKRGRGKTGQERRREGKSGSEGSRGGTNKCRWGVHPAVGS